MKVSCDKISAIHLNQLQKVLEQLGVSREHFLLATHIDREEIAVRRTISLSNYLYAVRIALELAPRPDLGFLVGKHTGLLSAGMLGYALLSSATLRDSLNRYLKYQMLLAPGLQIDWIQEGNQSRLTVQPALPGIFRDRDMLNYLTGQWLASWNDWSSIWGVPAGFFERIELGQGVASRAHTYTGLTDCPVVIAGEHTACLIDSRHLEQQPRRDERLFHLLGNDCPVGAVDGAHPYSDIVRRQLVLTPGHTPSMEEMAMTLLTSVRTLRRRLQNEGTTYQALLLDFRRYMGLHYLQSTPLPVKEIAGLVGFADTANFYRLFRDTTGMTPQSFRQLSWERRSA